MRPKHNHQECSKLLYSRDTGSWLKKITVVTVLLNSNLINGITFLSPSKALSLREKPSFLGKYWFWNQRVTCFQPSGWNIYQIIALDKNWKQWFRWEFKLKYLSSYSSVVDFTLISFFFNSCIKRIYTFKKYIKRICRYITMYIYSRIYV